MNKKPRATREPNRAAPGTKPKRYWMPVGVRGDFWIAWINNNRMKLIAELDDRATGWKTDYPLKIVRVEVSVVPKTAKRSAQAKPKPSQSHPQPRRKA